LYAAASAFFNLFSRHPLPACGMEKKGNKETKNKRTTLVHLAAVLALYQRGRAKTPVL
jgi:hypothetical protein